MAHFLHTNYYFRGNAQVQELITNALHFNIHHLKESLVISWALEPLSGRKRINQLWMLQVKRFFSPRRRSNRWRGGGWAESIEMRSWLDGFAPVQHHHQQRHQKQQQLWHCHDVCWNGRFITNISSFGVFQLIYITPEAKSGAPRKSVDLRMACKSYFHSTLPVSQNIEHELNHSTHCGNNDTIVAYPSPSITPADTFRSSSRRHRYEELAQKTDDFWNENLALQSILINNVVALALVLRVPQTSSPPPLQMTELLLRSSENPLAAEVAEWEGRQRRRRHTRDEMPLISGTFTSCQRRGGAGGIRAPMLRHSTRGDINLFMRWQM